jgi:hypothetical protein
VCRGCDVGAGLYALIEAGRFLHRKVEADVEARFTVFSGRPKVIGWA